MTCQPVLGVTKAVLPQVWMQSDNPFLSGHIDPVVLFGYYRKSFESTQKKPPPSPCPGSHNVGQVLLLGWRWEMGGNHLKGLLPLCYLCFVPKIAFI